MSKFDFKNESSYLQQYLNGLRHTWRFCDCFIPHRVFHQRFSLFSIYTWRSTFVFRDPDCERQEKCSMWRDKKKINKSASNKIVWTDAKKPPVWQSPLRALGTVSEIRLAAITERYVYPYTKYKLIFEQNVFSYRRLNAATL